MLTTLEEQAPTEASKANGRSKFDESSINHDMDDDDFEKLMGHIEKGANNL